MFQRGKIRSNWHAKLANAAYEPARPARVPAGFSSSGEDELNATMQSMMDRKCRRNVQRASCAQLSWPSVRFRQQEQPGPHARLEHQTLNHPDNRSSPCLTNRLGSLFWHFPSGLRDRRCHKLHRIRQGKLQFFRRWPDRQRLRAEACAHTRAR